MPYVEKKCIFAAELMIKKMSYGVMVALQILVLPV